jgi:hypothetical protein
MLGMLILITGAHLSKISIKIDAGMPNGAKSTFR